MSRRPPGRSARGSGFFWFCLCLLGGALQAAAIAWPLTGWSLPGTQTGQPSGFWQIVSLSLLVLALQYATRVGQAAWRGWIFSTVWLSGTFWWLFISLHTYGGLSAWLAVLAVLALAGLLSIYYAVAVGLLCSWAPVSRTAQALLFASLWTLAELARGHWFTGFPWGAGGYAQVDLMAPWAPLVGVYGMGFLAAILAYALASIVSGLWRRLSLWMLSPVSRPARTGVAGHMAAQGARVQARVVPGLTDGLWGMVRSALLLAIVGGLLVSMLGGGQAWRTLGQRGTSGAGELRVWLLQGNIAQDQKFEPGTGIAQALFWYPQQIGQAVEAARANPATGPQLVVAPETAFPLLPDQLGAEFWRPLLGKLAEQPAGGTSALVGLPLGSLQEGYTNSVWGLSPDSAAKARDRVDVPGAMASGLYRYDKNHLVPFGEFIPPLFRWFTDLLNIPLGDFNRGGLAQAPWTVAGQRVSPNICFEDLFGEELAASFTDEATAPSVLINLSNIAWFGDSVAIDQHLQISRLRAMELGRPMLRATNTGATAVIDHTGAVTHQLDRLTRGRLEATVQGRHGTTPYARWTARWGLMPMWIGCVLLVLLIASLRGLGRRGGRTRRR
ncbi:MAG: apolipoprotein N-acyltransferase [Hydrogenophaga sp.]|uniref:apolipoprotein N-acyltransferase n=1 Tax=Hydrogenophaga sp. TaxID=1904254 RepID=UPI00261A6A22|nr:apolipoprotein N-acyltransferase [Hydrogenophaga sp.]MDM7944658.1 apolipoprotein N-acyltransferase [Hydrogenophaga sp.]